LTAQQPYNNVVRTAIQALAAVLGGTQSLHTNSLDEAWALRRSSPPPLPCAPSRSSPTKPAVTNTVDPLGGSYFVETLTNEIDVALGITSRKSTPWAAWSRPSSAATRKREIAEASYRYQVAVDKKEKIIVGVNDFVAEESL